MRTLWGDLAVFDSHVHFFSRRFYALLASQKGPDATAASVCETLGWTLPPPEPEDLAAHWAGELDRHGVERSVLIASLPDDEESVARAVAAYPERFSGYFLLDPLSPDPARRCERALASGLRGIVLFPAMQGYSLHDERLRPVFECAASTPGSLVFVHCGVLSVGVRRKLGLPSHFDLRYSNPVQIHAIALRYPSLPFVVPHFGAGYFREALMVCDLCPNVYLDTSSTNGWTRYQEAPLDLPSVFARALAVTGPGRLLFGSDSSFFPRGWHRAIFDQQTAALHTLGADRATAAAILGGNLRKLLKNIHSTP